MTTPPPPPPEDSPGGYGHPSSGGPSDAPPPGPYGYPQQDAPGAQNPYGAPPPQGSPYGSGPYDPNNPYGGGAPHGAPYGSPYPGGGPYPGNPYGGMPPRQFSTTTAMWAHLGTLLALTVGTGVTCGLSGLAAWAVGLAIRSSATDRFTREHATQAMNMALSSLIVGAGMFVLSLIPFVVILMMVVAIAYGVAVIVFMIMATVAANKGQPYQYPAFLAFPMVKA
ncbi:DUF4870 domain-containing protein [Streptomyces sp. NPDC087440]|uniref:DUF4870 domain-containing protein n=1 Tax=Streptomyces sp. NPDC087440 TaxID=3365790 RepID=UPI0037FAFDD3